MLLTNKFGDALIKGGGEPTGKTALVWGSLKNNRPSGSVEQMVYVRYVSDASVSALNLSIEGNQRFIIANNLAKLETAFKLVKK